MSNSRISWLALPVVVLGLVLPTAAAVAQTPKAQARAAVQVEQGASLYRQHCALCHGADGRGGQGFPRPIWGAGNDIGKFGTARGLFEYMQMLMPFDNPQKMTDAEKLAVVAYMLVRNGNWKADATLELPQAGSVAIK